MKFPSKFGTDLTGFTYEVWDGDLMRQSQALRIGKSSTKRRTRSDASSMVVYATGTGLGLPTVKRETSFSKMASMDSRVSGGERLIATHTRSQPGSCATNHSNRERELRPTCAEEENEQSMGCAERKKGSVI
jgi:hypothetical protein